MGLGILPNNQKRWFGWYSEKPEIKPNYAPGYILFAIEFRLNKDVLHFKRSIYTSLDLLGDVGGLFDALKGISSMLVAFYFSIFGNPMHDYLLGALFLRNQN